MMHLLGFSHHYDKLCGQTYGTLIAIQRVTIDENFPVRGLCYDTKYEYVKEDVGSGATHGYGFEKFLNGECLQLIFLGNYQIPFTTYRQVPSNYQQREVYAPRSFVKSIPYSELIGHQFLFKFKGEKLTRKMKGMLLRDPVKIFA